MPGVPLDDLILALGGSAAVAEMTGRRRVPELAGEGGAMRLVPKPDNMSEKHAFLRGDKLVAPRLPPPSHARIPAR